MVTLIERLPKYCSRSVGLSSDSLPASFCSASRHSSAEFMCASLVNGRYRSRGRLAHRRHRAGNPEPRGREIMDAEPTRPTLAPTGDARVDQAIERLSDLDQIDLDERPAVLEEVHDRLREILGELGDAGRQAQGAAGPQARPGEPGRPGQQGVLPGGGAGGSAPGAGAP